MRYTLLAIIMLAVLGGKAQILEPVKWSYSAKKTSGNEALIFIKATIDNGWHIYSTKQKEGGPQRTHFIFMPSKDFALIGKITEPKPISKYEDVFDMQVMYFEKSVVFSQKIKLVSKQGVVKGKVEFMPCTNKECLPPKEIEFSIPVK